MFFTIPVTVSFRAIPSRSYGYDSLSLKVADGLSTYGLYSRNSMVYSCNYHIMILRQVRRSVKIIRPLICKAFHRFSYYTKVYAAFASGYADRNGIVK